MTASYRYKVLVMYSFEATKDLFFKAMNEEDSAAATIEFDYSDIVDVEEMKILPYDLFFIEGKTDQKGLDLVSQAIKMKCRKPIILMTSNWNSFIEHQAHTVGAIEHIFVDEINTSFIKNLIKRSINKWRIVNELTDKSQQYQKLFQKSIDAIFVAGRKGELMDVNDSFIKLLEVGRYRVSQINIMDLVVGGQRKIDSLMKILTRKRQITGEEIVVHSLKGRKIRCLLSMSPIVGLDGSIEGYQGILHDISKRTQAENQLKFNEKLSMTGRIARIIGHEVRNPLTNIRLSMNEIKEEVVSSDALNSYFEIIDRNVGRIENLVADLLNSAKSSEMTLEYESVKKLVKQSLKLCEDRVNLLEVKVNVELPASIPKVPMDLAQLKLAVLNILINAIEVVPENDGVVTIGCNDRIEEEFVEIYINDNGPGIAEDVVGQIFDPYFTAKDGGSGLGLTSAKSIVTGHRGYIDVDTQIGLGTTFRILLPKQ